MSIVEGAALSESSRDSKIAEKTFVRFERAHLFAKYKRRLARVIGVRGMIPAHFSKLNGGM